VFVCSQESARKKHWIIFGNRRFKIVDTFGMAS
jgi:hypothetical protein